MKIKIIPIFCDNYVWIIINNNNCCIIIDPGDDVPILNALKKYNLHPVAILLTHYHKDHIGGIKKLLKLYPKLYVFGPKEAMKLRTDKILKKNSYITILNYKFKIISTPGHTSNHISFYKKPHLFCGDVLFSGGCGKIENGMLIKMYISLKKITRLPQNTLIYPSHEYTLNNLKFSNSMYPKNKKISKFFKNVQNLRMKNKVTLPSTLKIEKEINPFLNLNKNFVKKSTKIHKDLTFELNILSKLRKMKEEFQK
ncbi:MAG: hydroxyacylglutathione hydrolase [Buchnera aphidicola (Nurudea yanoniella)]